MMRLWSLRSLLVVAGALVVSACHSPSKEAAPPEAEEKTAQVTVWGDRFEIFLEHRLLVVGVPTTFITHVTDLHTLEPRRDGPVTFVLRHGTQAPIEQVSPRPARDGIYLPEMTLPTAGEWLVTLRIPLEGHDYLVSLPPFTVFASPDEAQQAPEPEAPEGISFLKEQQWKILTQTVPVGKRPLVARLRLAGVVSVRPGNTATVMPPVAGELLPPPGSTFPFLGTQVKAGQVLALVQPHLAGSDLLTLLSTQQQIQAQEVELTVKAAEAEAEAIRSRATLTQAEQALLRMRALREQNAKSAREVEEAELAQRKAAADLAAAEALRKTYDKARKQLAEQPRLVDQSRSLPAIELKAPIRGMVATVRATVGEHIHTETPAFTILNLDTVLVEAQLPESELGRLAPSHGATYATVAQPGTFVPILGQGGGRLVAVGTTVDTRTRTLPLIYEVPNPQGRLRLGMALTVYAETAQVAEALAVPTAAIVEEDGRTIAFVQVSGETFQKRDVTIGIADGDVVQVLAGLAAGERVVTRGAYAIRLASVSTTIPAHGHAH